MPTVTNLGAVNVTFATVDQANVSFNGGIAHTNAGAMYCTGFIDASGNIAINNTTYNLAGTYTWTALQAIASPTNGQRALVSDLGNAEFVYDSTQAIWKKNEPLILCQSALPFIIPCSGSVGNNGALTLTSPGIISYAGAAGYATSCWMYFSAGVLFSASPANFYYTVMSSATAGTVYNNVYTYLFGVANPTPPTLTPIVATGTGAYATPTGSSIFGHTIPGKLLGPNGAIRCTFSVDVKNSATAKTMGSAFGGVLCFASAIASSQGYGFQSTTRNVGARTKQVTLYGGYGDIASAGQNTYTSSVDSAVDQSYQITASMASPTTTDYIVLTGFTLEALCA